MLQHKRVILPVVSTVIALLAGFVTKHNVSPTDVVIVTAIVAGINFAAGWLLDFDLRVLEEGRINTGVFRLALLASALWTVGIMFYVGSGRYAGMDDVLLAAAMTWPAGYVAVRAIYWVVQGFRPRA